MNEATVHQTELHRHLDVSVRTSTLLELAQEKGLVPEGTSLDRFRDEVYLRRPLTDLREVLAQFTLFQKVQDRPEVLERVAFEAVEDCRREGTRVVELRFSPSFVAEHSGLAWDEILASYSRGLARALETYQDMKAGLICIATRDYGPDSVAETVEFYLAHRRSLIAMDLAGNEVGFPCRDFAGAFAPLRKADGARLTVHAGEGTGPQNVWEAIELLGAQRIGHGIRSVEDPRLLQVLAAQGICLEVCPTSNWLTRCVPSLREHPITRLIKSDVKVSINTDDPGIFGVTLPGEFRVCTDEIGLTSADLDLCRRSAYQSSFLVR